MMLRVFLGEVFFDWRNLNGCFVFFREEGFFLVFRRGFWVENVCIFILSIFYFDIGEN